MAAETLSKSDTGETELWTGHASHWLYFWRWVFGILFVCGGIVGLAYNRENPSGIIGMGAGLLLIVSIFVARARRRYTVTNRRIVFERGLIIKSTNEVRVRDIRSINVAKSIIGGLMGVGTVEFSSAARDDADIIFRGIANADGVRNMVRELQNE